MLSSTDREFTEFVRREHAHLSRLAILLAGNRSGAEDLLQDALLKTYLAWRKAAPANPAGFTRRVLTNLAIDRWRRRRYETVPGLDGDLRPARDVERDVVADRDEIWRQLARLTARERAMVVLRYYADHSEAQVAEELGVSVGTVKSTCSHALAKLRPSAEPSPTGA